jgi:hypothetical protein
VREHDQTACRCRQDEIAEQVDLRDLDLVGAGRDAAQ